LKVSFNDCFHPEVPQPDSSNAYFPSDIEDPTVIQCDNFTALKLIADLYDICHLQTTMRHSKQLCDLENGSDSILREKQYCTVVLSFPI